VLCLFQTVSCLAASPWPLSAPLGHQAGSKVSEFTLDPLSDILNRNSPLVRGISPDAVDPLKVALNETSWKASCLGSYALALK
jgi:hypothetical protein